MRRLDSDTARLFVALDLPDAIRQSLAAWRPDVAGARWVPEDRMHLTLRFLGETSPHVTDAITGHMARLQAEPVPVETAGLIRLPSARRPRVLAARLVESPALGALAARLTAALAEAGVPAADRPLLPHVTLARFRQPEPAALRKALRTLGPPYASGVATTVSLVESRLSSEGPTYVTRSRVTLGETPPDARG